MIGKFHNPSSGGTTPDPATFCPVNGYIPNPLTEAKGWYKIAEFQTNSPSGTTFDPSLVVSSGLYAWDLGDETLSMDLLVVAHTYADSSVKTVKLYRKGTAIITTFDSSGDNIKGVLDLSNSAFAALVNILFYTNTEMTGFVLPATMTGVVAQVNIQTTGIIGALNLAMITAFTASGAIQLTSMPALTSVVFASTVTGMMSSINIYLTGIVGTLNLSMFPAFTSTAIINVANNPAMTALTLASSITGTFQQFIANTTGIVGNLDLTKITAFNTSALIYLHTCPARTNVTFAAVVTGTISTFLFYSTGQTGTLDVSMFTAFTVGANLQFHLNPSMTNILFAASISGKVTNLDLHGCHLGYVNILGFGAAFNVAYAALKFGTNYMTAADVNHMLVDLNSIITSGFTGRSISIEGGSNEAPDSTSGGYDGMTALIALQGKSINVTRTIVVPTLAATTAASSITRNTAVSGGNVLKEGGNVITARGVCWKTTSGPTIANSKTSDGTGFGTFTSNITGLIANTTYYVRAYATNSAGTGYGAEISFTTLP